MTGRFCDLCGADTILAPTEKGGVIELDATIPVWVRTTDRSESETVTFYVQDVSPRLAHVAHSAVCKGRRKS